MKQRQRFDQVLVEPQSAANGSADRCDLQSVGEPSTMVIAHFAGENLRLVGQPPVTTAMDDAIPIALKWPSVLVCRLRMTRPAELASETRKARAIGLQLDSGK